MKITLSKEKMLERCRKAGGLEPLRTDCTIELTDGIDLDAYLEPRLRKWYLDLLDTGPRELVAADNISATVSVSTNEYGDTGGAVLTMPALCRRVFDVKMRGWAAAAEVLPPSEYARVASLQLNPFTAATAAFPVAVSLPGSVAGKAADIAVWPCGSPARAESVIAALDPGGDYYTMDERALDDLIISKL